MYKRSLKHKTPPNDNSYCHYDTVNKDGKVLNKTYFGACHSNIKSNYHLTVDGAIVCFVALDSIHYSLFSLKRWLRFLKEMGFKATLLGVVKNNLNDINYYPIHKSDFYAVKFERKDYKNNTHLFAAITAFRLIYYNYSVSFTNIPERAFELKKIYGKNITNLQAITLAYHTLGCSEIGHAFIGNRDKFYNVTQEEFDENIIDGGVNRSLQNNKLTSSSVDIRKAWAGEDYKKLADLIQIKYE